MELGILFIRFVWDTMDDPFTFSIEPVGAVIARWHSQCKVILVNGGAVGLLVRMARNIQSYLEHSVSNDYPRSKAYRALEGLMEVLALYLYKEG